MFRSFAGRQIEVIDFEDLKTDERVLEFRDHSVSPDTLFAVCSRGGWEQATVELDPRNNSAPAPLFEWALTVARDLLGVDQL